MSDQKTSTEMEDLLSNPFGDIEIMNPATSLQKEPDKPMRLLDTLYRRKSTKSY